MKTHKVGNPLRPNISQIPTPTYQLAKHLNRLLSPYIPSKYRVQSSCDFLHIVRSSTPGGTIASLDVESLFTNVPVEETIGMICDKVYRDAGTPPLDIPEDALRDLLRLCTMRAPFITHKGQMFTQVDGVAMGSPLGVLFADFYMGVVEERVFSEYPEPEVYCRYVDDTYIKTTDADAVENLRQEFERHSSLRFTSENSQDNTLPFLDVLITQEERGVKTTVYRKPTNMGLCLNGKSECPERYRKSCINAYIRRALTHCSTWPATTTEIDNATQTLINNGFSNKEISKQIRKAIDQWYDQGTTPPEAAPEDAENIRLFYRGYWHRDYKKDEDALRNLISENVTCTNVNDKLSLVIYYKSRKSCNLILKNNPSPPPDNLKRRSVVYLFKCPVMGCAHEYIGMTTMRLSKRISCHAQEGAIYNHYSNIHNRHISRDQLVESIDIIDSAGDPRRLRYLEAIHILEKKPIINNTQEPLLLPSIVTPPPPRPPARR